MLKLSSFTVARPGRMTLVVSMAATIRLIFKSKHADTLTLRLLDQQLPPLLEACVFERVQPEICVVISKSPFKDSVHAICSVKGVVCP